MRISRNIHIYAISAALHVFLMISVEGFRGMHMLTHDLIITRIFHAVVCIKIDVICCACVGFKVQIFARIYHMFLAMIISLERTRDCFWHACTILRIRKLRTTKSSPFQLNIIGIAALNVFRRQTTLHETKLDCV